MPPRPPRPVLEPTAAPAAFDAVLLAGPPAHQPLAGMRLLERALLTMARAGAGRVLCVGTPPAGHLRTPDVPVTWIGRDGDPAAWANGCPRPIVAADAATVFDPATVAALAAAAPPGPLRAAGEARLWRCDPAALPALAAGGDVAGTALWTPPRAALLVRADTPGGYARAERALYANLGRAGDGWLTRVVDRRLSRLLTRALLPTGVSPNQITAAAILLGLAAGALFATGSPALATVAACVFFASTIVDGCDGEIARLTFRESRLGARFDLVGDNLVHLVLFGGIAWGLARRAPEGSAALLGVPLMVGVLLAMAAVYACIVRRPPTTAQRTLYESFASREFAYLLLAMTLAGALEWFLWIAVTGTYAFAASLCALGLGRRPVASRAAGR